MTEQKFKELRARLNLAHSGDDPECMGREALRVLAIVAKTISVGGMEAARARQLVALAGVILQDALNEVTAKK